MGRLTANTRSWPEGGEILKHWGLYLFILTLGGSLRGDCDESGGVKGEDSCWELDEWSHFRKKLLICRLDASWVDLLFFRGCEYGRGPDTGILDSFLLGCWD